MCSLSGKINSRRFVSLGLALFLVMLVPLLAFAGEQSVHQLVIMGTNDLHGYVMPWDYLTNQPSEDFGLAKTYSLVKEVRANNPNTLLIDAGDLIQGSLLAEYEARVNPLKPGEVPAIIQALNIMDVDVSAVGNHEFNFGLEYLDQAIAGAQFPIVNANIRDAETGENRFVPYVLLEREIDGKPITIGVFGVVPPQVMLWDGVLLRGKVYAEEIVDAAREFVPQMIADGADLIIAAAHTGIGRSSENAGLDLSEVDGIDVMILGHSHSTFPGGRSYNDLEGVDNEKGIINGVAAVMNGSWGSYLGVMELDLAYNNGSWEVLDSNSQLLSVEGAPIAPEIAEAVQSQHQATIDYVKSPVGSTAVPIKSYFSRMIDTEALQLINEAQLWFAKKHFKGTEYQDLPLLSAAAPFKSRTNIEVGGIAIMHAADLYIYSNTLQVVKVSGEELLGWLERSAENFNQIDPAIAADQQLIARFSGYNYDVIEGITYQIDITKPVGERIVNAEYQGEPIADEMEFLVATNNYRAGGGGYHLSDAEIVWSSDAENRNVIIEYVKEMGEINVRASNNWSLVPVDTAGRVVFTAPEEGQELIEELGITQISHIEGDLYQYNLK